MLTDKITFYKEKMSSYISLKIEKAIHGSRKYPLMQYEGVWQVVMACGLHPI